MLKQIHPFFLICFLLFAGHHSIHAAKTTNESVQSKSALPQKLKDFIYYVENNYPFTFVYNEDVKLQMPLDIPSDAQLELPELLRVTFKQTPLDFKIKKDHILLFKKPTKQITISGYVSDSLSGESLIGSNIIENRRKEGTPTNAYGFYSLTLPAGAVNLTYSYLGYESKQVNLSNLQNDTTLSIQLSSRLTIKEVVIVSDKKNTGFTSTKTGAMEIPMEQIKKMPAMLGEADVLKSIQMMPGVQSGLEGMSGMYVRGGSDDQNLYCLDGVPVYNVNHLLGFASVFTPDAVKQVDLYKGSFPARFGGRLSSVVDVHTNDGDLYRYHGLISIGLISSRINLQGPLWKGRTAFNFSARRSYVDVLARPFMPKDDQGFFYFYDVNLKINHRFSDKSRLYLSLYQGDDQMKTIYSSSYSYEENLYSEKDKSNINWGNQIGALRWNYLLTPKLFFNATLAYNSYRMKYQDESHNISPMNDNQNKYWYNSGIHDWNVKVDFDYYPNSHHHVGFGASYVYHTFKPEMYHSREINKNESVQTDTIYNGDNNKKIYTQDLSFYLDDDITLSDKITLNPGLRVTLFHVQQKNYYAIEPRLAARYAITPNFALKASYGRMSQAVHLLTTTAISLPTDLWVPITNRFKPMNSDQYALGAYYNLWNNWEFSFETYYKSLKHILEYNDGESFSGSSRYWEDIVSSGKGQSYGAEWMIQRKAGKATGWIAYTLSKSDRKFGITVNNGYRFPYKYDHRHNVNVVFNYKFNDRIDLGATWKFISGGAATVAFQQSVVLDPTSSDVIEINYAENRCNYRLPASHLLNLSINFNKKTKHGSRTWNISLYNAYNSMNPNFVYTEFKGEKSYEYDELTDKYIPKSDGKIVMKKMTIFPILPSFSYTYRF